MKIVPRKKTQRMNFGTIFDHFDSEEDKREAKEEFAALHPYGKEAAMLSDLQSNKVADLLTLAKTCFKSGNEEFACFYLDKHIQKVKETVRIELPLENEEAIAEAGGGGSVFFCYDVFVPQANDPIVALILGQCEKSYIAFNKRFEFDNGTPFEIFWKNGSIRDDVQNILNDELPFDLFSGLLLFEIFGMPMDKLSSGSENSLTVEQGMFLIKLFNSQEEIVDCVFNAMGSGDKLVKLMKLSGKIPGEIDITLIPPEEYKNLPVEIIPAFVKTLADEFTNFTQEMKEFLMPHRHLFEKVFSKGHSLFNSAVYHGLEFEPRELEAPRYDPLCTCKQIISMHGLTEYISELFEYLGTLVPSAAMRAASEGSLQFRVKRVKGQLDCVDLFESFHEKIPNEYVPFLVFEVSERDFRRYDKESQIIFRKMTKLFKTENNPFTVWESAENSD